MWKEVKPYLVAILMQVGSAGLSIVIKTGLNQGMSQHVLLVYRMVVAFCSFAPFAFLLERKSRPKMRIKMFAKIMLLNLFEPVLSQNLFHTGLKYTTATHAAAIANLLPALTFILACIFRLEQLEIRRVRCQAKVIGTVVSFGGAMVMTLIRGPSFELPWTKGRHHSAQPRSSSNAVEGNHPIKGALLLSAGSFSWACFLILQALILKSYPAKLSLTAWICMTAMAEGTVMALAFERSNTSVWSVHWNVNLLAALYGGMVSGASYYVNGWLMRQRGPVFVTAFGPLGMVIIAILSCSILGEKLTTGRILGGVAIVIGLYLVLWGKSKEHQEVEQAKEEGQATQKVVISKDNIETRIHTCSPPGT